MTHSEAFRPMINAAATVAAVTPVSTGHTGHAVRLRGSDSSGGVLARGAQLRASAIQRRCRALARNHHPTTPARCQLREICRLPPWSPRRRPFCLLPAFEGAEFQKVLCRSER